MEAHEATAVSQISLLTVGTLGNCYPCCNYIYISRYTLIRYFEYTETAITFLNKHYSLLNAAMCLDFEYSESAITVVNGYTVHSEMQQDLEYTESEITFVNKQQ